MRITVCGSTWSGALALYFSITIEHVLKTRKGVISDNAFHDEGLEKAKNNTKILRSDDSKNIDGIKKEAELSLEELSKIQKNSNEEMDEYVKSYNLNL